MRRPRLLLDRPCTEQTARFEPREGGRFCGSCQAMQYDLREAKRSEAIAVLREHGGRACVRVRVGPGGEPRFAPETPTRGVGAMGAAVAIALAACEGPSPNEAPAPTAIATPPPTEPVAPPPAPPTSAPTLPPTAPPPTTGADDGIDHSTDASPDADDHRRHRHRHPPAHTPRDDYDGGMTVDFDGL